MVISSLLMIKVRHDEPKLKNNFNLKSRLLVIFQLFPQPDLLSSIVTVANRQKIFHKLFFMT